MELFTLRAPSGPRLAPALYEVAFMRVKKLAPTWQRTGGEPEHLSNDACGLMRHRRCKIWLSSTLCYPSVCTLFASFPLRGPLRKKVTLLTGTGQTA